MRNWRHPSMLRWQATMAERPDPIPPRDVQERQKTGCLVIIAATLLGIVLAKLTERIW